jgi:hypothetical protein
MVDRSSAETATRVAHRPARVLLPLPARRLAAGSVSALVLVALFAAALFPLRSHLSVATTALVLVVPVVVGVAIGGFAAGAVATAIGFVVYDFVFIPPYYTLSSCAGCRREPGRQPAGRCARWRWSGRARLEELSRGGSIVRRVIREAGGVGLDVHVIARRDVPVRADPDPFAERIEARGVE